MSGAAEDGAGSDLHYASGGAPTRPWCHGAHGRPKVRKIRGGGAQGDANLGGAAAAPADGYRTVHSLP